MNQGTFFPDDDDEPVDPMARSSDPDTSHEAADNFRPKAAVYRALVVRAIAEGGTMTANEAAAYCEKHFGGNVESYRKRCNECVKRNTLKTLPKRKCSLTGERVLVYGLPGATPCQ